MYAAITAAQAGHQALVCEKNEKPGKKLYITGKGRCNVTNDCDPEEFLKNVCTNRKFLYSAIYGCTSQDVMDFFESHGLKLKTERGDRVFPASDHSSDVIAALRKTMQSFGIETRFRAPVKRILAEDGRAAGVVLENGEKICGRCRDCGHRRSCLSKHRFHRRRLPFCKRDGAYRDRAVSSTGSYEHQRRHSRKASGTFPEKCPGVCDGWKKADSTKISGK